MNWQAVQVFGLIAFGLIDVMLFACTMASLPSRESAPFAAAFAVCLGLTALLVGAVWA